MAVSAQDLALALGLELDEPEDPEAHEITLLPAVTRTVNAAQAWVADYAHESTPESILDEATIRLGAAMWESQGIAPERQHQSDLLGSSGARRLLDQWHEPTVG